MQNMSDQELIEQTLSGRTEAFGEVYDRWADKIYKFIYYRVGHKEEAEDITGRTFMKALKNLGRFSPEKGAFSTWLYTLAKNCVTDHYRRSRPLQTVGASDDLPGTSDLFEENADRLRLAEVEKYLKTLKPEQRELILLRVWDGLSYAEIAAIAGKSEASLRMMFSRAIKELRRKMPLSALIGFLLNF